ncbi:ABC transporter permease [Paenibacillus tarimensis]
MKAYIQLTLSQLRLFARNRQVLFWTMLFPIVFMIMLGSLLGNDNTVSLKGRLVDEDQSEMSAEVARQLLTGSVLQLEQTDSQEEALHLLREGDTGYVIVLPSGMGRKLEAGESAGEPAQVRLYTDETRLTVSELVKQAVSLQVDNISKMKTGYTPLLVVDPVGVQSLRLRYIDFLVPGIVAMMIMSNNLNGVAAQISSWRERGILRRMQSTPLHASAFIGAQITARLFLNGIQAVIVVLIGQLVFGTQVNGSWFLLLGLIIMGTLAFMSIGFIIAGLAKTPESAGPIAGFVSFPMLFLGGVFFPIQNMPDFLQPIVKLLPIAHLSTAMRQVMNAGAGLADIGYEAALLGGWMVAAFAVASFTFKWE